MADGLPYSWNGLLSVNSHVWGFIYKDNAGEYWIQTNSTYVWTVSFAASVNAWAGSFGISLNAPTGNGPQGPIHGVPKLPAAWNYHQCWTGGNNWA